VWVALVVAAIVGTGAYFLLPRLTVRQQTAAPPAAPAAAPAAAEHQLQIDEHMHKAEAALSQGNYDLAIEEYQAVLQFNPTSVRAKEGIERAKKAKAAESVILPGGKDSP
jgi:tetratricopeptide (TPR) repeat protein